MILWEIVQFKVIVQKLYRRAMNRYFPALPNNNSYYYNLSVSVQVRLLDSRVFSIYKNFVTKFDALVLKKWFSLMDINTLKKITSVPNNNEHKLYFHDIFRFSIFMNFKSLIIMKIFNPYFYHCQVLPPDLCEIGWTICK